MSTESLPPGPVSVGKQTDGDSAHRPDENLAEPAAEGTQTDLVEILHALADRWKELLQLVGGLMSEQRLRREGEGRFRFRMAIVGGVFLLAIVVTVALLTYSGKMDSSNLAFVLGVVVGAMLALTRDLITPPKGG